MLKFQEIDQFRHALKNIGWKAQFQGLDAAGEAIMNRLAILPKIQYEGTAKIHGCCSSIRIEGDKIYKVTCQSRNNEITPENDNYGFAKFITGLGDEVFDELRTMFGTNIVIHGEWAGKGIQDTVAVCQLEKFWTIFRVQEITEDEEKGRWISIQDKDFSILNKHRIFNVRQFGIFNLEIDFEHPAESINKMNELTLQVENECPVGKFFGISGIGEGIVWASPVPEYQNSKFVWKTKGSKHSKSKVTKLANVDVEKMASIEAFVDKHVNEGRLMQAWNYLAENKIEQDEKATGTFIKWIFNDIIKEEKDELLASGLTEKNLGGAVAKKAKNWFFAKFNQ